MNKVKKESIWKRLRQILTNRIFQIAIPAIIQVAFLSVTFLFLSGYSWIISLVSALITVGVLLYIINQDVNPAYKIAWIIPIMLLPVFGGLLYLLVGGDKSSSSFLKKMNRGYEGSFDHLKQNPESYLAMQQMSHEVALQSVYIQRGAGYPVYQKTQTTYFKEGESFFPRLLEDIRAAKDYIFLEFFILEEGIMWDTILMNLRQKVAEGLDVRLLYDDVGSLFTIPSNYCQMMEAYGIHCERFNSVSLLMNLRLNNRDHRKIVSIDGNIGYTGGCNLADEYINAYKKHGMWKDTMIRLEGEAVFSLTLTFLQNWRSCDPTHEEIDYDSYRPTHLPEMSGKEGFCQPYADSPMIKENVGENVYLNLINRAHRYIYITTPYFIVDNETMTALSLAAKSGVNVCLIVPHIPDKYLVHETTRSYYERLLSNGIRVYEFLPGFIHSKTVIVDDELATVGSINFDYRSLYLHFEIGVWMYKTPVIPAMKADFKETLSRSREILLLEAKKVSWIRRLFRSVLAVFAPLL